MYSSTIWAEKMQRADNELKGKMDCMDEDNKIKTSMELDGLWGSSVVTFGNTS
jgi:hypothetical protein